MLTGPEILRQIHLGRIAIDPFDPKRLNPNSYNLRLADKLLVYKSGQLLHNALNSKLHRDWLEETPLDMAREEETVELTIPKTGFVLYPGIVYLGSTIEHTETNGFIPVIEGRSSVGRLGLSVHVTAGFGDHGFNGDWTLELVATQPLRVYAGVEICQIAYTAMEGEPKPYAGKYQMQRGPKPSGLWREFPIKPE